METIRIIKRKRNKGTGYIWGILLALIILGAIAWILMDQNILDRDQFSINRESVENEENNRYDEKSFEDLERNRIKAYVSFVNREVIPADSIESQTTQKALTHFQMALNEVENGTITNNQNDNKSNDTITGSDSIGQEEPLVGSDSIEKPGNEESKAYAKKSLFEDGIKLVHIQENEYPSLSKMGMVLKKSIINLEKSENENSEYLKDFFISSSSLLQEMDSERTNNKLTYNK